MSSALILFNRVNTRQSLVVQKLCQGFLLLHLWYRGKNTNYHIWKEEWRLPEYFLARRLNITHPFQNCLIGMWKESTDLKNQQFTDSWFLNLPYRWSQWSGLLRACSLSRWGVTLCNRHSCIRNEAYGNVFKRSV